MRPFDIVIDFFSQQQFFLLFPRTMYHTDTELLTEFKTLLTEKKVFLYVNSYVSSKHHTHVAHVRDIVIRLSVLFLLILFRFRASFTHLVTLLRFYRSRPNDDGVVYCRFNERQTHRDRYTRRRRRRSKRAITELLFIVGDDDDVFIATNRRSCGAPAGDVRGEIRRFPEREIVRERTRGASLEISTSSTCAYVRTSLFVSRMRACASRHSHTHTHTHPSHSFS